MAHSREHEEEAVTEIVTDHPPPKRWCNRIVLSGEDQRWDVAFDGPILDGIGAAGPPGLAKLERSVTVGKGPDSRVRLGRFRYFVSAAEGYLFSALHRVVHAVAGEPSLRLEQPEYRSDLIVGTSFDVED